MSHRHREGPDQPLDPWSARRGDDDAPFDGCRRPICGHSAAAHDGPGNACGVTSCPCHTYAAPAYRAAVTALVLLVLAAFCVAMAIISGAHP